MKRCKCGKLIVIHGKYVSMCPDCILIDMFNKLVEKLANGDINIQQLRRQEWKNASHMQRYLRRMKYAGNSLMCRYIWRAELVSPNKFFRR